MDSWKEEALTMRLTATEVGFFEDYEDEEALEVGFAGVDESGVPRSFSIQRSTYEPDEQEIQSGMDSYNVSTGRGFTVYGCLRSVRLSGLVLTMEFSAEDAEILEISTPVEVHLSEAQADEGNLPRKLREILDWGSPEKRPSLVGLEV
ncbi:Imm10 family immunity protein [Streptomyces luteolus]|uniref:Imm10 family immunity protein n=1 Tax=Streptomyces luteolus TaxID=3043615 RepID=A0ABT6T4B8_9ACTN|nr:Imm10 family immunity protein [Streptomyces sp. B-S-A12]MDI3422700.1 Imm10 family immunity protein [Streptomyces sp. B-S-A12]